MLAFEKDLLEKINKKHDEEIKNLKTIIKYLQEINIGIQNLNKQLDDNEVNNE